jgi:hypothetical protein
MLLDVYVRSCPANVSKTLGPVQPEHFMSLKIKYIHHDSQRKYCI